MFKITCVFVTVSRTTMVETAERSMLFNFELFGVVEFKVSNGYVSKTGLCD